MLAKHKLCTKIFFLLLILLSVNNVMSTSSEIPLEGNSARPGKEIKVQLKKLYSGINYIVTCKIQSDNPNPADAISYVQIFVESALSNIRIYIDGKLAINPSDSPNEIKSHGSELQFFRVKKETEALVIKNLDYTDSLSAHHCVARIEG